MVSRESLPDWIRIQNCKKVRTRDLQSRDNGFLVEVLNRHDEIYKGREAELFQQIYYTSVYGGMFKGFHIHPHKLDTVTCIFGKALLVVYPEMIAREHSDFLMDLNKLLIIPLDTEANMITVSFPSKYPHGYFGISSVSFVLNYRNPAWHPGDKEQYDYWNDGIEQHLAGWSENNESR